MGDAAAPSVRESLIQRVKSHYEDIYGVSCELVAVAPGRVNLIGEHIDYSGFDVLPMAIDRVSCVAIGFRTDDEVHVANIEPAFPSWRGSGSAAYSVSSCEIPWVRFVLAGRRGAGMVSEGALRRGANVMVGGNVPQGAGLSSSSSLVCASVLAHVALADGSDSFSLDHAKRGELAVAAARCERLVGTEGGGMDQAISFYGAQDTAQRISFGAGTVSATPVSLPRSASIVVAHSLDTHSLAHSAYNTRVCECRIAAAALLQANAGIERQENGDYNARGIGCVLPIGAETLEQSLPRVYGRPPVLRDALSQAKGLDDAVPAGPIPLRDAIALLGLGDGGATSALCAGSDGTQLVEASTEVRPGDRASHVFAEAQRVSLFHVRSFASGGACRQEICEKAARGEMTGEEACRALGKLMDESHTSCAKLFSCSCDSLDELVDTFRRNGALGARLTGAGWGGCAIALVPEGQADEVLAAVRREFHEPRLHRARADPASPFARSSPADVAFVTRASPGAHVFFC